MALMTAERAAAETPVPLIRVVVVDDDPLVRKGLRLLLGGCSDIEVVAEAGDGIEAELATDKHQPDLLLMDIRMPRRDGLEATRRLRARVGPPQIIVLTTFNADEYVLDALRAGAAGFLLKDSPPQQILAALRSVAAGAHSLSPEVLRTLIGQVTDNATDARRHHALAQMAKLTGREHDVAVAMGQCLTNATIARRLGLGVNTVKGYTSQVLRKLNLNNRSQVVLLIHDAGLL